MTFQYKTTKLNLGETLVVPDGDMLVGANIEPDGKGGYRVSVHLLTRNDGVPIQPAYNAQERTQ